MEHSYCVALFHERQQIGFARVITDYATFGYLCDVFVLPAFRGRGLGKWLVESTLRSEKLKEVKKMMLATKDAHGLYAKFGFKRLSQPDYYMERLK